ncbi:MAG: acyl transferase [Bacteroidia bacterium]|nr:acyl transferase [Bacteroidia bacterium]
MQTIPSEITKRQEQLQDEIFEISTQQEFEKKSLEIFQIQSKYCQPYNTYLSLLGVDPEKINTLQQIPFLPVQLFKNHNISCFNGQPQAIFTSSATTGMIPSKHPVKSLSLYSRSFTSAFRRFFGEPSGYNILALLPSYLEREGSSLVYMAQELICMSGKPHSGFYLYNFEELRNTLLQLKESNQKTILLGVTFALLDFAKDYRISYPNLTVVETGGMKGRGQELSRDKVHQLLTEQLGIQKVASEYGMAELLSQAWSLGDGLFDTPPWMDILIRDTSDPFKCLEDGKTGGVNIIDLANIYSCSFVQTEDMGKKEAGNSFRITGRINNSELRGCNLLLEN